MTKSFLFGWLAVASLRSAGPAVNPEMFAPANMTEVKLNGLTVRLGKPVEVASVLGWEVGWRPAEHYIAGATRDPSAHFSRAGTHLVPFLARVPRGNLIATYALDPDTQENPVYVNGFQFSQDGGAHWGKRYTVIMQHQELVYIPKPPDSLLGVASELTERTPGDNRNLIGPAYLFEHGGERMVFLPDGIKLVDWPWPVEVVETKQQPRTNWHAGIHITGNAFELGGRLLATVYGEKKDDWMPGTKKLVRRSMLATSEDGGYTWRYLSEIAHSDLAHATERSYEGPDETSCIPLADGDLMAVFRVGSGRKWNLDRAYSHDGGKTWTQPDTLPAWSVWPQLLRTADGTIALATGRPGIGLWLSTDGRGRNWEQIDVVAYHNRWAPDPTYRIDSFPVSTNDPYLTEPVKWQTTSYNAIVQVAPNKLLLLYDRSTERVPKDSNDLSRVFVLPIEIERGAD